MKKFGVLVFRLRNQSTIQLTNEAASSTARRFAFLALPKLGLATIPHTMGISLNDNLNNGGFSIPLTTGKPVPDIFG